MPGVASETFVTVIPAVGAMRVVGTERERIARRSLAGREARPSRA